MSSENMTLEDVLKFAVKVEHESYLFYKSAVEIVTDKSVGELLIALKEEEEKHEDRLSKILEKSLDKTVFEFAGEELEVLIKNKKIPTDATAKTVLKVALDREIATRDFYSKVATLTNIDATVADVFNMLYDQESGHVTKISKMLEIL